MLTGLDLDQAILEQANIIRSLQASFTKSESTNLEVLVSICNAINQSTQAWETLIQVRDAQKPAISKPLLGSPFDATAAKLSYDDEN